MDSSQKTHKRGVSIAELVQRYDTHAKCVELLEKLRWWLRLVGSPVGKLITEKITAAVLFD
jgi:hypothetical protein